MKKSEMKMILDKLEHDFYFYMISEGDKEERYLQRVRKLEQEILFMCEEDD